MSKAAEEVFKNRTQFIIVGLTGRSGSGCTTTADLLNSSFDDLDLPQPCLSNVATDHDRKRYIVYNFARKNWKAFFHIKVSDIITSFVLECTFSEFYNYVLSKFSKDITSLKDDFEEFYRKNKCLDPVFAENYKEADKIAIRNYIKNELPSFSVKLKQFLGDTQEGAYTSIYQEIGNNIRSFGVATPQGESNVEHIYALAERINRLIKILRKGKRHSYFVIDAFRNPFESLFFQERYSAFYLLGIRCPENDRLDRLINTPKFSKPKIDEIDKREYPKNAPLKNMGAFLSQDIATCIQMSDIHIDNPGKHDNKDLNDLKEQLARYISLIQHPGLINPSNNEKMMQIAFTAKLNSGCLSRKVGAVVTNSSGIPKALGWNSSPTGQTSCLLRNAKIMTSNTDRNAYSQYEKTDEKIVAIAKEYVSSFSEELNKRGLNCSFCFKDFQNKKDGEGNQVHNRALHAEENAFLQVAKFGGEGVINGKLYTTASPCDLCSRKAYQLGIKEIYYIDPYPGIAERHVLNVGEDHPKLILFRGAIGSAYHKLYSSILPYKDELYSYLTKNIFEKKDKTQEAVPSP